MLQDPSRNLTLSLFGRKVIKRGQKTNSSDPFIYRCWLPPFRDHIEIVKLELKRKLEFELKLKQKPKPNHCCCLVVVFVFVVA